MTSKDLPEYITGFYPEVYGLVLAGGASKRMGEDKALLKYHGVTQAERVYNLLNQFLPQVYVSSRKDQLKASTASGLPQLFDKFENLGPYSGILTAMEEHRNVAWLVVACDLPYLDASSLEYLLEHRNPTRVATCFESATDGLPEPLCAIWEPASRDLILDRVEMKAYCPRKLLIQSDVETLSPINDRALMNCNTPDDYMRIRKAMVEELA